MKKKKKKKKKKETKDCLQNNGGVMFSEETLVSQFYAFCRHVRRPLKQWDNPRYIVPTVKNASKS